MVIHRAPYRDPVIDALEKTGEVDSFSIHATDGGHRFAHFKDDVAALFGRGLVFRLLRKFVLSRRYGLVIWPAYYPRWLTLPILVSAVLGRRYAISLDTNTELGGAFTRFLKRYMFQHADFLWVPGASSRTYLMDEFGVEGDRIVEGLYVVDRHAVSLSGASRSDSNRPRHLLMVGNDVPARRIDVLVEGFKRGRRAGEVLTLCGKGCGKFSGDGVVAIEGVPWSELPRLYAEADVYVHNGREQYSTAVQIAAMRGLPIVCSAQVGIVADFRDEGRGLMRVKQWEFPEAWAEAFRHVARLSTEQLRVMGQCARAESEQFDVDAVVANIRSRLYC